MTISPDNSQTTDRKRRLSKPEKRILKQLKEAAARRAREDFRAWQEWRRQGFGSDEAWRRVRVRSRDMLGD